MTDHGPQEKKPDWLVEDNHDWFPFWTNVFIVVELQLLAILLALLGLLIWRTW